MLTKNYFNAKKKTLLGPNIYGIFKKSSNGAHIDLVLHPIWLINQKMIYEK